MGMPPLALATTGYGYADLCAALPATTTLLRHYEAPLEPLDDVAESVAERLVTIAHLCFNPDVWGSSKGRSYNYWRALCQRLESAANEGTLPGWWERLAASEGGMSLRPVRRTLLAEKCALVRPTLLTGGTCTDTDVLEVFREYPTDLADRCQAWNRSRKAAEALHVAADPTGLGVAAIQEATAE